MNQCRADQKDDLRHLLLKWSLHESPHAPCIGYCDVHLRSRLECVVVVFCFFFELRELVWCPFGFEKASSGRVKTKVKTLALLGIQNHDVFEQV